MTKIAKSLAVIAFVAIAASGATTSFFSDEEKSVGNTFTAGTIDISVDDQNPWTTRWENYLDKPCETNYMVFEVENVGENPANLWKKIVVTSETGGDNSYCGASSEPEYVEGGGSFGEGVCKNGSGEGSGYTEQADLSSYMIYDMAVCTPGTSQDLCLFVNGEENEGPLLGGGSGWEVIIREDQEIRVDNVNDIWISLGKLEPKQKLIVVQSYHLKAWTDAGVETITNWAQGDIMTFNVELEARQLTAPAPNGVALATLQLAEKDPITWNVVESGASGTLTFKTASDEFDYTFSATGLNQSTNYSLIYYADPWPGNHPGKLITTFTTDTSGNILSTSGTIDLGMDLPVSTDANYPAGAKIQLVLSNDYNGTDSLTAWHPSEYLFEMNLIQYNDTNYTP